MKAELVKLMNSKKLDSGKSSSKGSDPWKLLRDQCLTLLFNIFTLELKHKYKSFLENLWVAARLENQ